MGNIFKSALQHSIRPGTIWWLPVTYILDYPPDFLRYDEKNKEHYIDQQNEYWCNEEDLSYKTGLGSTKVVSIAEIRPFLVIQKPDMLQTMKELVVPVWYRNAVTGFPISSVSNLQENLVGSGRVKIDIDRLKDRNDYEFIHYLPNDNITDLKKESYIVLAAIATLNIEYFTDKRGSITDSDYKKIKAKINKYFDF